jgi:hypothetical protein
MTRPTPWLQVGFLPRRRPVPWPAWALLVCGLGLFLAAALAWRGAGTQRADAEQALHSWQAEQTRQRRVVTRTVQPTPAAPAAATRDAQRTAQRVAALLDHPWAGLFATIETLSPPGLQWLRLEHEAEAGEVQLEGLAREGQQALQVVDALSSTPGWQDVALSRLEAGANPEAGNTLRFEVRAHQGNSAP